MGIKKGIGKEIWLKRNEAGLTQKQLAKKLESTASYICRIESGENNPSMEFIERICKILNVEIKLQYKVSQENYKKHGKSN
jgi:transcriptional regulator with XRE-family HTH domain